MEKSNDVDVILFRDMAEEGWRSMDRYADNLTIALERVASSRFPFSPPSQKTRGVSPWMNANGGPSEARRAQEGASADSAEEMKDTTGVSPWRLHFSTFTCRKTSFIKPLRPFVKWMPFFGDYVNDLHFSRFLKYPWLAGRRSRGFAFSHVLDHSYAHLLYWLTSPLKVVTCHDLLPLEFEKDAAALRAFRYSIGGLERADLVLADSRDTRYDLENKLGILGDKVRVVPLAVDLAKFRPKNNRDELERMRNRYRLPSGRIILHVGNNLVYKNLEGILQALAIVSGKALEPVFLLKVGHLSDGQRSLAQQLGVGERIVEKEVVPDEDLVYLYNLADFLVYPSLKEGFGFPVLEAMACGRPVLVSRGTSLEEITGRLGVFVDPKSTEDIAQKVYEILFRFHPLLHGEREELRGRAEKFTWQRTAQLTLSAYEELLTDFWKVRP